MWEFPVFSLKKSQRNFDKCVNKEIKLIKNVNFRNKSFFREYRISRYRNWTNAKATKTAIKTESKTSCSEMVGTAYPKYGVCYDVLMPKTIWENNESHSTINSTDMNICVPVNQSMMVATEMSKVMKSAIFWRRVITPPFFLFEMFLIWCWWLKPPI